MAAILAATLLLPLTAAGGARAERSAAQGDILFSEGFEGATTLVDPALSESTSAIDSSVAFSGAKALNMCAGESCKFSYRMDLREAVDQAYARYMFLVGNHEAWYDPSGKPLTGEHYKNMGLEGGDSSCKGGGSHSEPTCIAARTRLTNPWAGVHLEGYAGQGDTIDNVDKTINVVDGKWHCLEIMVRLNTPGKSDGEARYWVDSKETVIAGLDFRGTNTWQISKYWWTYWSNDNWKGPIYVDDVVVSKSRIGCPTGDPGGTATPLPTPTEPPLPTATPRPTATPDPNAIFVDVPSSHWAYRYIQAVYRAGFTAGCKSEPLSYCPDAIMNRAEMAVYMERGIHGASFVPPDPPVATFSDVPAGYWGYNWIEGLYADQYTDGCAVNPLQFCPFQTITRAEGSVYYLRMQNGSDFQPPAAEGLFVDVPVTFWGARWAEAAYKAGIIPACQTSPDLRFCPNGSLDRAMAAYMMVQAKGLATE